MTYIKVATTSFSAASTVNVDNVFSANYTHYLVVKNLSGSVALTNIGFRLRVSGADATAANYRRQYVKATSTTVSGGRVTGDTLWDVGFGRTESTAFGFVQLRISNPFDAARTTAWTDESYDASANIEITRNAWAHDLATSYTGFTLIPGSGNITGSVTVYGLKES